MIKEKVAIIDTNFSSSPIYEYLVKLHFDVFVIGNNPNDYLAKISPNYVNIDYSNKELLTQFLNDNEINFIVPGCNDLSYNSCSLINDSKGFKGIETLTNIETINKKNLFKKFCNNNSIPTPKKIEPSQIKTKLPVIVKPVNLYSGRGITKISKNNFKNWEKILYETKKYSGSEEIIIEEFLSGQLYSHSAFIRKKEILYDFFVEEHCITNPYAVDTSTIALNLKREVKDNIRENLSKLTQKLELVDGLIHTQFLCQGDNYWLIESTRRSPGDLYSLLIEKATGFPYSNYYTDTFIDMDIKSDIKSGIKKYVLRHTISSPKKISLKSLKFHHPVPINELYFFETSGSSIQKSPNGRIGVVFFVLDSIKELNDLLKRIKSKDLYVLQ